MKNLFTEKDEYFHSAIWYICKNGFAKILEYLVIGNSFGFQNEIIEAVRENDEYPSLLYIATYYQREVVIQLLMEKPFICEENEKYNGLSLSNLKDLRAGTFKQKVKLTMLK